MEHGTTVKITTSIPEEMWKQAMLADIKWNEAVKLGITAILGLDGEKVKVEEKIKEKERELLALKEQLKNITMKENKENKERERRVVLRG